jgi:hypothetical protein
MIIEIDDWKFDVDLTATMEYSAAEAAEHCTCGYCRNFYAAVDSVYPNLRPFLAQFGIDIEAPEQLSPYEGTLLDAHYAVKGRVLRFGRCPMTVDGLSVAVCDGDDLYINVNCLNPYFVLETGLMELPWLLDEAMDEVVSTANEPSFLEKMVSRLIDLLPDTPEQ